MNLLSVKKMKILLILSSVVLLIVDFFDKGLFAGIVMIVVLSVITFFALNKIGNGDKKIYLLFLVVLVVHTAAALFMHYAKFQPFGDGYGDYITYQQQALQVIQEISKGNFLLNGLWLYNDYPAFLGYLYVLTVPSMLVGQLFNVWLSAVTVGLVYLITREIGVSKKWAFITGLLVCFYPSYLFYGSLLLKDTATIFFAIFGLLLSIKMVKSFSWLNFALFFASLTALMHLRFYIGFALLFSFIICWFLLSSVKGKERFYLGLVIIFLLGFSPQIVGYGYYGSTPFKDYLNQKAISLYREVVYAPPVEVPKIGPSSVPAGNAGSTNSSCNNTTTCNSTSTNGSQPGENFGVLPTSASSSGLGSSFVIKVGFNSPFQFVFNYFLSFTLSLLGPLPWQIKSATQMFALLETLPWYLLLCLFLYSLINLIRKMGLLKTIRYYRLALPLFLFSMMALGALSLYMNNFGIITRIRIPVFISLFCLFSLSLDQSRFAEKMFSYIENIIMRLAPRSKDLFAFLEKA